MEKNRTLMIRDWWQPLTTRLKERGTLPQLPIKTLPTLNKKMWGIRKGKLTIIGARTSQGKSSLAVQVANDLSLQGKRVLFLSLEMDAEDITERIFCNEFKVDNGELLRGKISKYGKEYQDFKKAIQSRPLVISDSIGWTWNEIDDFLQKLEIKPDVVFVDYIQTIKTVGKDKLEVLNEYVRKMREMAIRENMGVVLISQINRVGQDTKDKTPELHHLKGSGYLEEHADVILLLHWPWKYNKKADKSKYTLWIAKNRNGVTGWVTLKFFPAFYFFEDGPEDEQEDQPVYTRAVGELNYTLGGKDV